MTLARHVLDLVAFTAALVALVYWAVGVGLTVWDRIGDRLRIAIACAFDLVILAAGCRAVVVVILFCTGQYR